MIDVVLLHAFPMDCRMWTDTDGALAPTAAVHTPDLPGFGTSAGQSIHSVDDMAEAVHEYVRSQGLENFVLGGLSMGGYVAFAYWRRYHSEGRIQGLVLADTRAEPDDEVGRQRRTAGAAKVRQEGTAALVEDLVGRMFSESADAQVIARARSVMEEQPPDGVAAALEAMRDRPDSSDLLETIDVPVAVLCGTEDVLSPPAGMRKMVQRLPDATWFPIRGAGHLANLENPLQFNAALVAFLMGLE